MPALIHIKQAGTDMKQTAIDLKSCSDCPIRHRAVCARCEPDELARLEQIKYYRSYEAGQNMIWSGDRMDFVASIVTGVATLTQTMEDGRTQMVGLLLPSDFIRRTSSGGRAATMRPTTSPPSRPSPSAASASAPSRT